MGVFQCKYDLSLWLDHCLPDIPRIQRLVRLAPTALRTKYVRRGVVEEWFDSSKRLLLVGEAAHPILVRAVA